jgi:hypothetical protein
LCELPETLDETYERILTNISARNIKFARRAFQLLAFDHSIISLSELAEAVVVNDEQCSFDPADRLMDPEDLLEICTCLIAYDEEEFPQVQLAHYSVKEYLVSERARPAIFQISDRESDIFAAKICITYLLNLPYKDFPKFDHHFPQQTDPDYYPLKIPKDTYPFIRAAITWDVAVSGVGVEDVVSVLILKLLNPCEPHFSGWLDQMDAWYCELDFGFFPKWTFNPGAELSVTIAYTCFFDLESTAKALLDRDSDFSILENQLEVEKTHWRTTWYCNKSDVFPEWAYGTPLHIAAALGKPFFVGLLIGKGANTNAITRNGFTILHSAVEYYERIGVESLLEVLEQLVNANAHLNPPYIAETPLQAAVRKRHDISIIRFLLSHGADVNGVGNDEAVVAKIRYDLRDENDRNLVDNMIHCRGNAYYYDTPLRIAENKRRANFSMYQPFVKEEMLIELKELLKSYGAKSLHLFPVEDLPGYVEADMQAIPEDIEDKIDASSESEGVFEDREDEVDASLEGEGE